MLTAKAGMSKPIYAAGGLRKYAVFWSRSGPLPRHRRLRGAGFTASFGVPRLIGSRCLPPRRRRNAGGAKGARHAEDELLRGLRSGSFARSAKWRQLHA